MPSSSGNLGLLAPVGGDFPSEYRTSITQHAALLGNALSVVEGTFANRAAVVATAFPSGVPLGLVYQATDTGVWYQWSGTAWLTVMLAGAWVALTLNASDSIAAIGYTPSVRLEGDTARLKGGMQNQSGGTLTGAIWATIPSGYRPTTTLSPIKSVQGAPGQVGISSAGVISVGAAVLNNQNVFLDGETYSLS